MLVRMDSTKLMPWQAKLMDATLRPPPPRGNRCAKGNSKRIFISPASFLHISWVKERVGIPRS